MSRFFKLALVFGEYGKKLTFSSLKNGNKISNSFIQLFEKIENLDKKIIENLGKKCENRIPRFFIVCSKFQFPI
jgi:hypothetical protein